MAGRYCHAVAEVSLTGEIRYLRLVQLAVGTSIREETLELTVAPIEGGIAGERREVWVGPEHDPVGRFKELAVGDVVTVEGIRAPLPAPAEAESMVAPGHFGGEQAIRVTELKVQREPEAEREQWKRQAVRSAVEASTAGDAMVEAMRTFAVCGGDPSEAQEAVVSALAGGSGIDDFLAAEAEMVAGDIEQDSLALGL